MAVASLPSMTLVQALEAFPNIEQVLILRTDMTRLGVEFTQAARDELKRRDDFQCKGLHLFSQTMDKATLLRDKIPVLAYIEDGTLSGTQLVIRTGGQTPYAIDFVDGEFWALWNGKRVAKIARWAGRLPWDGLSLPDGTPMVAIVEGVGSPMDRAFVTVNKHCEYFNIKKQCLFCDIVPNAAAQKAAGDPMVTHKRVEQVCDALELAITLGTRHVFLTGGTFLGYYQGKTDLEYYGTLLEAIGRRLVQWPFITFQMGPLDEDGLKRIHDTGVPDIQMNLEVWNKRLFEIICPGKAAHVGYDEWLRRMLKAVEIWGWGRVSCNLVAGVEMCQPYGFTDVDEAVDSIAEAYEWMMSNGIAVRYGEMWVVEGGSLLAGNSNPPLEFYLKAGLRYNESRERHFPHPHPWIYGYNRGYAFSLDGDMYFWHGTGVGSRQYQEKAGMRFGPKPDYTKYL